MKERGDEGKRPSDEKERERSGVPSLPFGLRVRLASL